MLTHLHDPCCTVWHIVDIEGYHMTADDMSLLHKVAALEAIRCILEISVLSRVPTDTPGWLLR